MKNIIITHSDLDGIMGGILGMLYTGSSNVMYMPNPNPGATNTAIDMMVENYKGPLTLTVVDRCSPTVDYIESLKDRGIDIVKYTICDHHITSMPDHKAAIDAIGPEKCIAMLDTELSGTENIYKLIEEKYPKLANIVSTVGNWDTFRWKDMDNLAQYEAKKLNGICAVLGNRARQVFSDIVMNTMKCDIDPLHYIFTKYDILADIYNDKIADSKRDSLTYGVRTVVTNSNGDKCKLLLATFLDYSIISQVADDILFDPDENIDVVVFLHSSGSVSVRSKSTSFLTAKDVAVKVGEMTGLGGGGHILAAGTKWQSGYDWSETAESIVLKSLEDMGLKIEHVFK